MNCMASVTNLIIVTDCCVVHMLLCLSSDHLTKHTSEQH